MKYTGKALRYPLGLGFLDWYSQSPLRLRTYHGEATTGRSRRKGCALQT